ncbi:hemin ABC transporter substrate-binding protein [Asinibacterium sp. OR53]|uniref:heme/hemin ABC transporter substrate-binding protein n=1 Tax=Asinibacterium sp. OR53 TaxID=925409 RepID=UPI00047CD27E|nr:ABC transporter substrate-binding protein [Asinibacterium sp. OR53]
MKKIQTFYWIFLLLFISACGRFSNKEADMKRDMRIVSISKHLTEMLFALGKGHNLVACDLTSTYPDSAKLLPSVGYHRALSVEGIISMKPDLVIHSNDIGPATVLPQLEKAGIHLRAFGGAATFDSARLLLKELGVALGTEAKADSIIRKMDADRLEVDQALSAVKDTPSVMVIHYGQANNVFFVMSGRNGAADKMIAMAGGKAARYDAKGAHQISAEAIAIANPDVIIATNYGFDKMGGAEQFKTLPGVALTNAAKNNRIYRFEEHDLVYFGPRSGKNILQLMQLIHATGHAKTQ